MPRVMVVEWPDGLRPRGRPWDEVVRAVDAIRPDLLITNEMPFGPWCPGQRDYRPDVADAWVRLHEDGVEALSSLSAGAVLSSRPVPEGQRLANEAFTLIDGHYVARYRKQFLPEEPGWYEATWFEASMGGGAVHDVAGLRVGFMLCTDLMFNEHARRLGRAGADLIAVPRATGLRRDSWETAARMAALVGGCYVATSNRVGRATSTGPTFGGHGFIVGPGGGIDVATDASAPAAGMALDLALPAAAKRDYPYYVPDPANAVP